jgi:hypothetical protein
VSEASGTKVGDAKFCTRDCPDTLETPRGGGGFETCPFCGEGAGIVQVHGHGQCARCGTNILPCCEGAPSVVPVDDRKIFPRGEAVE